MTRRNQPQQNRAISIARQRLANQFLLQSGFTTGAEVVRALGAVQAQDYPSAKWALSMRTRTAATDAAIERELTDGQIIRTHVLRPTWHFVAPEDLRWMLALTAPRVNLTMGHYFRKYELDAAVFRRSYAAITKALAGKELTRQELKKSLERARIGPLPTVRLGLLMERAELDQIICSGAVRGKQFTYALMDERVPATRGGALDHDEALQELTRRYFTTRGPATMNDFAWWSSLTIADIKRGIEIAGRELERLEIDGVGYWQSRNGVPVPRTPTAHLLPNYDEYFIGFKDRGAFGQRLGDRMKTAGTTFFAHVVVVDGQLVGGWKRATTKDSASVSLTLLTSLGADEKRRIEAAARKLSAFLARPVTLR